MSVAAVPGAMTTITLEIRPPSARPTTPGWYLVWQAMADYPTVVWNGAHAPGWRQGAQALKIDAWAGPLPERKR